MIIPTHIAGIILLATAPLYLLYLGIALPHQWDWPTWTKYAGGISGTVIGLFCWIILAFMSDESNVKRHTPKEVEELIDDAGSMDSGGDGAT